MPPSFIENLRMSGIYNPPTASRINPLEGGYGGYNGAGGMDSWRSIPPNYAGNAAQGGIQNQMLLNQINRQNTFAESKPQNVVYQPPLSDTYQGRLLNIAQQNAGVKQDTSAATLALKQADLGLKKTKQEQDFQIKQQRANVYDWKAKNPNHQIKIVGDRIVGFNPATNDIVDLGESGGMDKKDELEFNRQTGLEKIDAQDTARRGQITLQGEIGSRQIGERGEQTRETDAAKPPKEMLPTQVKVQRYLRAQELISKNPALSQYITMGPNDFTIEPGWGADPAILKQVTDYIYGEPTMPSGTTKSNTSTSSTNKETVKKDTVPQGAKPGGTWIDTKFGRVYKEP